LHALRFKGCGQEKGSACEKTGILNSMRRHPDGISALRSAPLKSIHRSNTPIEVDSHCRYGLLEQWIETTFQVVSILIGYVV
jgi:hypothetical protein